MAKGWHDNIPVSLTRYRAMKAYHSDITRWL